MPSLAGVVSRVVVLGAALLAASFVEQLHAPAPWLGVVHGEVEAFWARVGPGGQWHPASFIEHKGHLVVEGLLVVVISYLLIQSSFKPGPSRDADLSDKEIDELCEEWQPEPLWGSVPPSQQGRQDPVISSETGTQVVANGQKALNLASFNFLGLAGNPEIREAAHATIQRYGVGSCGPRGFYGTMDVHLQLEERLARLTGTEEAILYSYDLATLPSIIPAFANKKDLVVVDEACNWSIQSGCQLSRARVLYFKHNDAEDLERVLKKVEADDRRLKRPLCRRFILVEGIYQNYGDMAPLQRIRELKERYRYRLVIDESLSLGVLGEHGRGAAEHAGFAPGDVEIVGASLGNALASVGGFCAGEREVADHQRLSGLGYCYSASLPPYLAAAGIAAIDQLEQRGPQLMQQLHSNARLFRRLAAALPHLSVVGGEGAEVSPVVHLALTPTPKRDQYEAGDASLQRVVDDCLAREGVMLALARYSCLERTRPPPSIRVAISAAHTPKELEKAVAALRASCKRILG